MLYLLNRARTAGVGSTDSPLTRQLIDPAWGCLALYFYAALPASQLEGRHFAFGRKEDAMLALSGGGGSVAIR